MDVIPYDIYKTYLDWINNAGKGIDPPIGADSTMEAYFFAIENLADIPRDVLNIIRTGSIRCLNVEEAVMLRNWLSGQKIEKVLPDLMPKATDSFIKNLDKLKKPLIITGVGFLLLWIWSRRH